MRGVVPQQGEEPVSDRRFYLTVAVMVIGMPVFFVLWLRWTIWLFTTVLP